MKGNKGELSSKLSTLLLEGSLKSK